MNIKVVIAIAGLAVAVTGCQRSVGALNTGQPAPLTPAPIGGVTSNQLPPTTAPGASQFPEAPQANTMDPAEAAARETQLAAAAPEVTREALIGRWSVESGGATCDVFLALTKWTGGYRAASRGCAGDAANISAWDVQGKQVILSDNSGNQIARLYQSGNERYDGSTSAGRPISLSR